MRRENSASALDEKWIRRRNKRSGTCKMIKRCHILIDIEVGIMGACLLRWVRTFWTLRRFSLDVNHIKELKNNWKTCKASLLGLQLATRHIDCHTTEQIKPFSILYFHVTVLHCHSQFHHSINVCTSVPFSFFSSSIQFNNNLLYLILSHLHCHSAKMSGHIFF